MSKHVIGREAYNLYPALRIQQASERFCFKTLIFVVLIIANKTYPIIFPIIYIRVNKEMQHQIGVSGLLFFPALLDRYFR